MAESSAIETPSTLRDVRGGSWPVVLGALLFYVTALSVLAVRRWIAWRYGFDNGFFAQTMALLVSGNLGGVDHTSHWSPILLLLTPVFALWPSGLTLQIVQLVLLGASAVPAYALARRYLDDARSFALLVLFYPPMLAFAYGDPHEAAFVPVLIWALCWAIDQERFALFALFAIAAVSVREDVALALGVFGCVIAMLGARRKGGKATGLLHGTFQRPLHVALAGAFLMLAGFGTGLVYLGLHDPYTADSSRIGRLYDYPFSHGGPLKLLAALAADPARIPLIMNLEKLMYVPRLVVPLAFLPFLSPWSFLAAPALATILLSSDRDVWTPELQYVGLVAPWLQLGALDALRRVQRASEGTARAWLACAAFATVTILLVANPMHLGRYQAAAYARDEAAEAVAVVPAGEALAVPIPWYPPFAPARPNLRPYLCDDTPWAVYGAGDPNPKVQAAVARLEREIAQGITTRFARFGDVSVYRRLRANASAHHCTGEF